MDMMKSKALRLEPYEIPTTAVAVALDEAIKRGYLTDEGRTWIENRADVLMGWLASGSVIDMDEDGFYKLSSLTIDDMEKEFNASNLTIGGDDD